MTRDFHERRRTAIDPHFSTLAPGYDVLLCDVWGVVHNGVTAFADACDALMRARARGATVVLLPMRRGQSEVVARQLDKLHVPRETYDAIVSSGDVTRGVLEQRAGQAMFHVQLERLLLYLQPGPRIAFRAAGAGGLRGRRGLDDDDVEMVATTTAPGSKPCWRASCSWSAAIPT